MSDRNMNDALDVVLYDRQTGEVLQEMQTLTVNREERAGITMDSDGIRIRGANMTFQGPGDAEPVQMGTVGEVIARGQLDTRTEQSRASRSIAGGTIDRQRREEEEAWEPQTWEVGADWNSGFANMGGTTWLGGPDMRMTTGTIQATQLNLDSMRDTLGTVTADTITAGTLTSVSINQDLTGPSEPVSIGSMEQLTEVYGGLPAESIRYEDLEPIGTLPDGEWRTAEGVGELDVAPNIRFSNGSEIRTLPSSYMGDASDIVRRINEAPRTEPFTANYIDLNGHVMFSNLHPSNNAEALRDLSTTQIVNQAVEAVRGLAQPYIEREVPDVVAQTIAVAENAGTWIAVPQEENYTWRTSGDSWVSQGIYPNEVGNGVFHKGCWFFGNQLDNVVGKTIHRATLKIKKCFSVGGNSVPVYIVGHPHENLPTTEPYISKVSILQRFHAIELDPIRIDLEPFHDLISKGLIKGFGVYTEENGLTNFASFERDAELEITWY